MDAATQPLFADNAPTAAKAVYLWVSDCPIPENVFAALGGAGVRPMSLRDPIGDHADGARVALVYPGPAEANVHLVSGVFEQLRHRSMMGMVLVNAPRSPLARLAGRQGNLAVADVAGAPAALAGHLSALCQLQPALAAHLSPSGW